MLYIGIDPGVKTGVALWETGKLTALLTTDFWGVIEYITQFNKTRVKVVIEDPNENKPVFDKGGQFARDVGTLARSGRTDKLMQAINGRLKQAQNIGSNKREASLLIEYCKIKGIEVITRPPLKGHLSKMDAAKFKLITGYAGKSSQHARDAAGLVIGY